MTNKRTNNSEGNSTDNTDTGKADLCGLGTVGGMDEAGFNNQLSAMSGQL